VLGWAHLARAMDSPDPTWQVRSPAALVQYCGSIV
jgi:hypothetical protein